MIKELINTYFARHYGLQRASSIDDVSTNEPRFDLLDKTPIIFPFGSGYASFANASNDDIHNFPTLSGFVTFSSPRKAVIQTT